MHKHLLKYLDRFNLIHTHQSGFRPQHSCQSALTCLVDRLLSSINDSKLNGVVFLGLKKAFDLIDHQILLKRMKTYQLSDNAIQFFNHILAKENRRYLLLDIIHLEGSVKVGVPQGSDRRGPNLFYPVFI